MGKLADLIYKEFGVRTIPRENPLVSSVGSTVVKVLNNNPDRIAFLIFNLGDYSLYVAPNNKVSTSRGILLSSSGGFLNMLFKQDFELVGHNFYAVAPGGTTAIFILELVAE